MSARERLLNAAERCFYRDGITQTGIDTLVEEADVAKMSLYNNFASKDELIIAYLRRRHEGWEKRVASHVTRTDVAPAERVLGVFDVYLTYAEESGFRGCAFINGAAELGPDHPAHEVIREHKREIRRLIDDQLREAGIRSSEALASHLEFLLEGGVAVAGIQRDARPLIEARETAAELLRAHLEDGGRAARSGKGRRRGR